MAIELNDQITELPNSYIERIVRSIFGSRFVRLASGLSAERLDAVSVGQGTVALIRCTGTAGTLDGTKDWSAILKVLRHGESNRYGISTATASTRWEVEAYRLNLFRRRQGPFRGAKCHFIDERDDRTTWLWMEDLASFSGANWNPSQYLLAARGIGEFRGSCITEGIEEQPWLVKNSVVSELPVQPILVAMQEALEATEQSDYVRAALPGTLYEKSIRLKDNIDLFVAAAMKLPSTLAHNDCHVRNLFVSDPENGGPEVVAIDFARVGIEHLGIDAGDLFGSGFTWTDSESDTLMGIVEPYYSAWLKGLHAGGWDGPDLHARFGFLAPLLRRSINVAGIPAYIDQRLNGYEFTLQRYEGAEEDLPASIRPRFEFLLPLIEEGTQLARQIVDT